MKECDYNFKRGWWCSREKDHEGPCALYPANIFMAILVWWCIGVWCYKWQNGNTSETTNEEVERLQPYWRATELNADCAESRSTEN